MKSAFEAWGVVIVICIIRLRNGIADMVGRSPYPIIIARHHTLPTLKLLCDDADVSVSIDAKIRNWGFDVPVCTTPYGCADH